jgi:hypothetical protein
MEFNIATTTFGRGESNERDFECYGRKAKADGDEEHFGQPGLALCPSSSPSNFTADVCGNLALRMGSRPGTVAEDALIEANQAIVKIALQFANDFTWIRPMRRSGGRYHNEKDPFTAEDIAARIDDCLDKKLKPNVRSASLPSPNDDPVVESNAETFQKVVRLTGPMICV